MTTLTKMELSESIAYRTKIDIADAKVFVEGVFETIAEALAQGEEVKISGFGNFNVRRKKERPGRNPKTGEDASIEARTVVTFHAGTKLKSRVEDLPTEQESA
jgi:integration host factor subunit alpha